jgi:hypothetical protein
LNTPSDDVIHRTVKEINDTYSVNEISDFISKMIDEYGLIARKPKPEFKYLTEDGLKALKIGIKRFLLSKKRKPIKKRGIDIIISIITALVTILLVSFINTCNSNTKNKEEVYTKSEVDSLLNNVESEKQD